MDDADRVTLRDYFERWIGQYERSHAQVHDMLARQLDKDRQHADDRSDRENQIRDQILEERADMVKVQVFKAEMNALRAEVLAVDQRSRDMKAVQDNLTGKVTGIGLAFGAFITLVNLGIALFVK